MITNVPTKYAHLFTDADTYPNTKVVGVLRNEDESDLCFICTNSWGNACAYLFRNGKYYSNIYSAWRLTVEQLRHSEELEGEHTIWEAA